MTPEISIVIPVKNAAPYLTDLLKSLQSQQLSSRPELLLLDSCSSDGTIPLAREHWPDLRAERIENFSHGGTRNRGAELAQGSLVVFLTQDALPIGVNWLTCLIAPLLEDETVAAAYSRQIPRPDAPLLEKHHIATQFPEGPAGVQRSSGGETPSVEMCFLSNASAVYRRELLLRHPFDPHLIMGEDQQVARDLLRAGFGIAYAADSLVRHSHSYTSPQTFRRYFDSAVANRDLFPPGSARTHNRQALRGHMRRVGNLLRHQPALLPLLFWDTLLKILAVSLGHHYKRIPRSVCEKLSMHRYYWSNSGSK